MAKLNIRGAIVSNDDSWAYDYFDMEYVTPKMVNDTIKNANGKEINVSINSTGGDVFAASEIYTALKSYAGQVNVQIVGIAASAASVIAMAGKEVEMSPTAQMMIHNVSTYTEGDYRDMEHTAEILKNANETIANAYRLKSGKTQDELLKLMDGETWFTAQKAKELRLIDKIMFEDEAPQLVASSFLPGLLPREVIATMKNELQEKAKIKALRVKLSHLRLKGEKENG